MDKALSDSLEHTTNMQIRILLIDIKKVLKYHVVLLCYFALKKVSGSGERSESCKRAPQSLRPAQPSTAFFLSCCSQPPVTAAGNPMVWLWHQGIEDTGKAGWVNKRFPLARETMCMGQSVQHYQVPEPTPPWHCGYVQSAPLGQGA